MFQKTFVFWNIIFDEIQNRIKRKIQKENLYFLDSNNSLIYSIMKKIKIEYTMKNIEGKDYLQYEWLEMDKIDEYPLLPRAVKDILKENKFPIHKINNDLK